MNLIYQLKNIWVHYNSIIALEAVNLDVYQNDYLAIIGPNGGGKSTLLKAMLGLIKPSQGTISIFEKPLSQNKYQVGYVPQISHADREFPINVFKTVLLGRLGTRKGVFFRFNKNDLEIAEQALKSVGMQDFKNRQIGALSEGQRQRVFIARALTSQPKILLLDEPTASVDLKNQEEVYELLNNLRKKMAIVMVSHDLAAVSKYVDKIACLNKKLHYHGAKEEICECIADEVYGCDIDLIAHGHPHRVLGDH